MFYNHVIICAMTSFEEEYPRYEESDDGDYVPTDDEGNPYSQELLDTFSFRDGAGIFPLFDNVQIVEQEGELSFTVPRRYLDAGNLGKWELDVYGRRRWFKEHDDYGSTVFFASGKGIWAPHLFPFEEITDQGLPVIPDQERCQIIVSMKPMHACFPDEDPKIALSTPAGNLIGKDDLNLEISYGTEKSYYEWFKMIGRPLVSQLLVYGKQWKSFTDYLNDPETPGSMDDYDKILDQEMPIPQEYLQSTEPLDWTKRPNSDYESTAFGQIWIPVSILRRGAEATISFPNLLARK